MLIFNNLGGPITAGRFTNISNAQTAAIDPNKPPVVVTGDPSIDQNPFSDPYAAQQDALTTPAAPFYKTWWGLAGLALVGYLVYHVVSTRDDDE